MRFAVFACISIVTIAADNGPLAAEDDLVLLQMHAHRKNDPEATHNDWWYGASEGGTACAVSGDEQRCGLPEWSAIAGNQACAEKGTQSPIDIKTVDAAANADLSALVLTDVGAFTNVEFERNSHTTEVVFSEESGSADKMKVVWGGVDYFLKQFHFHSPSENTIDGKYYPMEVHHVHQNAAGQALVLAVMIDSKATTENAYYKKVWEGINSVEDGAANEAKLVNEGELSESPYTGVLPANKDYFHYIGSFTTPPCTTQTIWILLKNSISITTAQLEEYRLKIQASPMSQIASCDTARCGGTTPTGVADQMAPGSIWDESQGTNNRDLQDLTGANDNLRGVYQFTTENWQCMKFCYHEKSARISWEGGRCNWPTCWGCAECPSS